MSVKEEQDRPQIETVHSGKRLEAAEREGQTMLDFSFDIAAASSRKAVKWKNRTMTWKQLIEKISHPIETPETYAEYMAMDKARQDNIKDKGGFVGGRLREGKRRKGYVEHRSLLCLDMDFATADFWENFILLYDYTCCLYSTHKHCREKPRYRLILPLSRPVTEEEYEALGRKFTEHIGMDLFDETTYEASRLMYWPTKSREVDYEWNCQEGSLLDADELLGEYKNWRDCRQWPRSPRAQKHSAYERKQLGDPREKDGIIGDFCRAYSVPEAIAAFLQEVYIPCREMGDNRYTYAAGTTSGGAVVYEENFLYSHHATDPAGGSSHNSFDLVRIHLFGHLDETVKEGMKYPPSMKAMIHFAQKDEKVRRQSQKQVLEAFEEKDADKLELRESSSGDLAEERQEPADIVFYNARGTRCLNALKLAEYIRQHCAYLVVRKRGHESEFVYWYEEGCYHLVSSNEFKGKIKAFIPDEFCRPHAWEEVYKHLITDAAITDFDKLNSCEEYINFKNGLYNLNTRRLEPHSSQVFSSIQLNASYNPQASNPSVWLSFISRLGNEDPSLIAILQEWVGLTLSNIYGYKSKKCLALVSRIGNTGKTQFNNILGDLLGDDNVCSTPIQRFEKSFGLGSIYGCRAILIDDQTATTVDDSSYFKQITGGGKIDCEIKGKQSFPYIFKGTLTFGCNDLPYFKGDKGDHLFQRILIIPSERVLEPHERNACIRQEMALELDGIVLWALEGLHRLIEQDYGFTYSKASEKAMAEYRSVNDSLYRFISSYYQITKSDKDRVGKAEVEAAYRKWCLENEIEPIKKKNIPTRAAKLGIGLKKNSIWYFTCLKALEDSRLE